MVALFKSQKYLGVILEKHLDFHEHIERKIKIGNKLIGTIKQLFVNLPRKTLLTICKSFVRMVIYDNLVKSNS